MASGEVKLDALPYFDKGYDDPGVREAVSADKQLIIPFNAHHHQAMQLVEEETKRYRPTKNYIEFLQPPKSTFEVNTYKQEFNRAKYILGLQCVDPTTQE